MILDFSSDNGAQYSLKCINQSSNNWYFYIYQRISDQSNNDIYSLIWMASPYKIGTQSFMTFRWSADYSFHWFDTGKLQVGVTPGSGGSIAADLSTGNETTFDSKDNTPQLSPPVQIASPSGFSIVQGSNIPNNIFSTGIGMSGFAISVKQSLVNTMQMFDSDTTFWVAATTQQIQATAVLSQDAIMNSSVFAFPLNVYNLTATLGENNLWTVG